MPIFGPYFKSTFVKYFFSKPSSLSLFVVLLFAFSCNNPTNPKTINVTPKTRTYYIAAEEVVWDYVPDSSDVFMGNSMSMVHQHQDQHHMDMPKEEDEEHEKHHGDMHMGHEDMETHHEHTMKMVEGFEPGEAKFAVNQPDGHHPHIGRRYKKARFVAYTDSTFTQKAPIPAEWQHLGIMGPVIRANVGDSVVVCFKNNTTIYTSFHVHGLRYGKGSEGAPYNDGTNGDGNIIKPGEKYTYHFYTPESAGPTEGQPSSTVWLYHSHVDMDEADVYAGLVGAIIVTKKGMGDENAKPIDVDREFVNLFMIFDENSSPYLKDNEQTYCPGFSNPDPDDFVESNKKHSINGLMMGNLKGLDMKRGERVRWYIVGLGNEDDLHTPHWHGNTVVCNGKRTDVLELLPATMLVADMNAENPGIWAYHCHISDHMMAGMTALYKVE